MGTMPRLVQPCTRGLNDLKKVRDSIENDERKGRPQKSHVKTMLTAFFDSKGFIHDEYVPFVQIGNATFYLSVSKQLVARIHHMRL